MSGRSVGITKILKREGLDRAHCPHCNRQFSILRYYQRAFQIIIDATHVGERILVVGFGAFKKDEFSAEEIGGGFASYAKKLLSLNFKPSEHVTKKFTMTE